jgi:uncharacterized protein YbaR (Trm112 family)
MALLPEGLIDIMQCPGCAGRLLERADPPALICEKCRLAYPVAAGGIPVMLTEEAVSLDAEPSDDPAQDA